MHRTKIRVAEDALDANQTIANANRHDFDHAGVAVVNMMSAPGAGKTTLLEAGSLAERVAADNLEVEAERLWHDLAQSADRDLDRGHPPAVGMAQRRVDDRARDRELVHQLASA